MEIKKNNIELFRLFTCIDKWQLNWLNDYEDQNQYLISQDWPWKHPVEHILEYIRSGSGCNPVQTPSGLLQAIELAVIHQSCLFWKNTFRAVGKTLGKIDQSISSDSKTRAMVDHWRYLFGIWRSMFPIMHEQLHSTLTRVEMLFPKGKNSDSKELRRTLLRLLQLCEALQDRNERTSQAVMSTLSIMES